MDSIAGQNSGRGASRRSGKRPMQFMFIDSTSHGVNAKPDKAVRSFVMKSARSKKPWSTRQKSPKEDAGPAAASPADGNIQLSSALSQSDDFALPSASPSWQYLAESPAAWSASSNRSSVSSRSGTFLSTHSPSQPYLTPPPSSCSPCDIAECSGDSCGQPHTSKQLTNLDGFAVGFTADFNCLPVETDRNARELLETFVHTCSADFVPLDRHCSSRKATISWVSKGILSSTGAPFIYAILTSSALYRQFAGLTEPQHVLHHKINAIVEINKLLDDSRHRVDDNVIAAVFMLLCIEESAVTANEDIEWSTVQRKLHQNGLKTMIQQRGGLAALSSNPCLQTFILMHSVAHAIATFERPYAALVDSTGHIQQYDIPSFRDRPASTRILRLFHPLAINDDLYDLLTNIVVFVGDLNVWNDDANCPVDPIEMQKHVCLLVYRLFDWYKLGEEGRVSERNPVDQCVCLALVIFLTIAYNQNYTFMVYAASQRLKAALEKCILFRWANAPDLLMWTLTMGGLATRGTDGFEFFRKYCVMAFEDQGFSAATNAEEVLDRMRKCLWLTKLDNDVKSLWAQMGICKGDEFALEMLESGYKSPDQIKKEDIVGGLTNERFFNKKS